MARSKSKRGDARLLNTSDYSFLDLTNKPKTAQSNYSSRKERHGKKSHKQLLLIRKPPEPSSKQGKVGGFLGIFKSKKQQLKSKDAIDGVNSKGTPVWSTRKRNKYTRHSVDCFCRTCLGLSDVVSSNRSRYKLQAGRSFTRAASSEWVGAFDSESSRARTNTRSWRKSRRPSIWSPSRSISDTQIVHNTKILDDAMGGISKNRNMSPWLHPESMNASSAYRYASPTYPSMGLWKPAGRLPRQPMLKPRRNHYHHHPRHPWASYPEALSSDESDESSTELWRKARRKYPPADSPHRNQSASGSISSDHNVRESSDENLRKPEINYVEKSNKDTDMNPSKPVKIEKEKTKKKKLDSGSQSPTGKTPTTAFKADSSKTKELASSDIKADFSQFLQALKEIQEKNENVVLQISTRRLSSSEACG